MIKNLWMVSYTITLCVIVCEYPLEARVVLTNVELLTRGGVEKESLNMTRFLNRILGLPVQLQNLVFTYFTDTIASLVQKAKREGKWDSGILDFGASGEHVEILYTQEFVTGVATTKLNTVCHIYSALRVCCDRERHSLLYRDSNYVIIGMIFIWLFFTSTMESI